MIIARPYDPTALKKFIAAYENLTWKQGLISCWQKLHRYYRVPEKNMKKLVQKKTAK